MTRFRQRSLVLVVGAVFLAGLGGLVASAPALAQTPTPGQVVFGSGAGYPFVTTFPYVGPAQQAIFGAPFGSPATYSTLTGTPSIFPYASFGLNPLTIGSPTVFEPANSIAVQFKVVSSQISGAYCTDHTGGMVWIPAGAPMSAVLMCSGGSTVSSS